MGDNTGHSFNAISLIVTVLAIISMLKKQMHNSTCFSDRLIKFLLFLHDSGNNEDRSKNEAEHGPYHQVCK